jgi:hypothetical protein
MSYGEIGYFNDPSDDDDVANDPEVITARAEELRDERREDGIADTSRI